MILFEGRLVQYALLNAVYTKFFQDRSGDSVNPARGGYRAWIAGKWTVSIQSLAESRKVPKLIISVYYGLDGFMGDVIAQNGNRIAHVFADVLSPYIPGRIVIDKRKGIVHRETEELDVASAAVERVIGQQREGQR